MLKPTKGQLKDPTRAGGMPKTGGTDMDKWVPAGLDPLEYEKLLKQITPDGTNYMENEIKKDFQIERNAQELVLYNPSSSQRDKTNAKNKLKALSFAEHMLDAAKRKGQYQKQFFIEFLAWTLGKGKAEDHLVTPWKNKPLDFPDIIAWRELFVEKRYAFIKKIMHLKMAGPMNLHEAYLYFKYIVKRGGAGITPDPKNIIGPEDLDYLMEFDMLAETPPFFAGSHSRLNRDPGTKGPINPETGKAVDIDYTRPVYDVNGKYVGREPAKWIDPWDTIANRDGRIPYVPAPKSQRDPRILDALTDTKYGLTENERKLLAEFADENFNLKDAEQEKKDMIKSTVTKILQKPIEEVGHDDTEHSGDDASNQNQLQGQLGQRLDKLDNTLQALLQFLQQGGMGRPYEPGTKEPPKLSPKEDPNYIENLKKWIAEYESRTGVKSALDPLPGTAEQQMQDFAVLNQHAFAERNKDLGLPPPGGLVPELYKGAETGKSYMMKTSGMVSDEYRKRLIESEAFNREEIERQQKINAENERKAKSKTRGATEHGERQLERKPATNEQSVTTTTESVAPTIETEGREWRLGDIPRPIDFEGMKVLTQGETALQQQPLTEEDKQIEQKLAQLRRVDPNATERERLAKLMEAREKGLTEAQVLAQQPLAEEDKQIEQALQRMKQSRDITAADKEELAKMIEAQEQVKPTTITQEVQQAQTKVAELDKQIEEAKQNIEQVVEKLMPAKTAIASNKLADNKTRAVEVARGGDLQLGQKKELQPIIEAPRPPAPRTRPPPPRTQPPRPSAEQKKIETVITPVVQSAVQQVVEKQLPQIQEQIQTAVQQAVEDAVDTAKGIPKTAIAPPAVEVGPQKKKK